MENQFDYINANWSSEVNWIVSVQYKVIYSKKVGQNIPHTIYCYSSNEIMNAEYNGNFLRLIKIWKMKIYRETFLLLSGLKWYRQKSEKQWRIMSTKKKTAKKSIGNEKYNNKWLCFIEKWNKSIDTINKYKIDLVNALQATIDNRQFIIASNFSVFNCSSVWLSLIKSEIVKETDLRWIKGE